MKILTTVLTAAIFLAVLTPSARASEAGALMPAAAAAILPPGHQTIGQLSGSQFVTGQSAERSATDDAKWHRRWAVSLAPLFASEALDASSSYGMRELNPLLASPSGGFGMKATGVKFGVIGALAGVEYFLVRKYPRSAKAFAIVNWTTAGATTGLAVHNYRLH
jgi:hypothetical protein